MSETSRFIRPILKFFFPTASEQNLQFIHGYIRKTAHFTEYALLAFLALRAFSTSSVDRVLKLKYILPLILVAAIAAADEFNQSFEASRTGSVWDVLLDISGGAAIILFLWVSNLQRNNVSLDLQRPAGK